MKTYYIHPETNGHIRVSSRYMRKRKEVSYLAFTVDLPGHWHETKYNCHVDGCDYLFESLPEACCWAALVLQFNGEKFEFKNTDEPFNGEL